MNPKITKLRSEREKNSAKISELQGRNKEIDAQIAEYENTDIIGLVRASGLTLEQLAQLIQSMKTKPAPVSAGYHDEMEDTNEEN